LALKLLTPEHLREVLAGTPEIRSKALQLQDQGQFLLDVLAELDPQVPELVHGLLALDNGGEAPTSEVAPSGAQPEPAAPGSDEEVVEAAQQRLAVPRTSMELAAIKRLTGMYGLGQEVELALRMLSREHLKEILVAEKELAQKVAERGEAGQVMLFLISQLDPDVEALVRKLLEMETRGAEEEEGAEDESQRSEEVLQEAMARLERNSTSMSNNAISAFLSALSLDEAEVDLYLRMLAPTLLFKFVSGKAQLKQELGSVQDRNARVREMIVQLDPKVEALVSSYLALDQELAGAADTGLAAAAPAAAAPAKRPRLQSPVPQRGSAVSRVPGVTGPRFPVAATSGPVAGQRLGYAGAGQRPGVAAPRRAIERQQPGTVWTHPGPLMRQRPTIVGQRTGLAGLR